MSNAVFIVCGVSVRLIVEVAKGKDEWYIKKCRVGLSSRTFTGDLWWEKTKWTVEETGGKQITDITIVTDCCDDSYIAAVPYHGILLWLASAPPPFPFSFSYSFFFYSPAGPPTFFFFFFFFPFNSLPRPRMRHQRRGLKGCKHQKGGSNDDREWFIGKSDSAISLQRYLPHTKLLSHIS